MIEVRQVFDAADHSNVTHETAATAAKVSKALGKP
jgi:hypothetical protein